MMAYSEALVCTFKNLPLWGSAFVNLDTEAIINDESATIKFAIEPFSCDISFSTVGWWEVLERQNKPILITGLEDHRLEILNGKAVTIMYGWWDREHHLTEPNQDSLAVVKPIGWKIEDIFEIDEKTGKYSLVFDEIELQKRTQKDTIKINYRYLRLSNDDKQNRLKMYFSSTLRLKKQTHIGLCYFPCVEFVGYHWSFKPDVYWHLNDYNIYKNGTAGSDGHGCEWMFLRDTIPEIFKNCHRIKIDVFMYQILQYPHDLTGYWDAEVHGEKDAEKIVKDQTEIQKILQPLLLSNQNMIENLEKENNNLKQELAELRQWKLKQLKENDDEKKENKKETEFSVGNWLNAINLEKYSDVLVNSGYDDLEGILDLNVDDLKEIGIIPGHRKKILKAVAKLRDQTSSTENKLVEKVKEIE